MSLALALVPVQENSRSVFHQLCETDRQIVEKKRLDAHHLIQKLIAEPSTSLALVPVSQKRNWKKNHQIFTESPMYPKIHMDYTVQTFKMETPKCMSEVYELKTNENQQLALCQNPVKSLKAALEHELAELGISKLEMMPCHNCKTPYPADHLYMITLPVKDHRKTENTTVYRCLGCWRGPIPSRNLYECLIKGKAEQFARNVGKRVEYLYGEWDERLTPMVEMLKANVLLAEDIEQLLKKCMNPMEFNGTCDVIILTTIAFYMDYIGFRRATESLLAIKPTTTYAQLFEIFSIFFPNRAKGVKTGDFL